MGVLSGLDLHRAFPPITSRSLLSHYLPVSGAISHSLFTVHIFNPSIVSRMFPVAELAVSNSILFNANLGLGFYIYYRKHLHGLNAYDRVEFSVLASTIFNFGSLLAAVVTKALLPAKIPVWGRSLIAASLSIFLLSRARKYVHHLDTRTTRASSPRSPRSPVSMLEKNGHTVVGEVSSSNDRHSVPRTH